MHLTIRAEARSNSGIDKVARAFEEFIQYVVIRELVLADATRTPGIVVRNDNHVAGDDVGCLPRCTHMLIEPLVAGRNIVAPYEECYFIDRSRSC